MLWSWNVLEPYQRAEFAEFATPFLIFLFYWADTSMAMLQCSEHLSIEFIDNDSSSQDSKQFSGRDGFDYLGLASLFAS